MNGRGNGFNINSRGVSNSSSRAVPSDVLFPRGSNLSPLSNSNYYANITQASSSVGQAFSGRSNSSSARTQYVQRLDAAQRPPTYNDSFGNKRLMPESYHQTPLAEKSSTVNGTAGVESAVGALSAVRSTALSAAGGPGVALAAQAAQQIDRNWLNSQGK